MEHNRVNYYRDRFRARQRCMGFPKIWEPPQNSRRQKGDMQQIPHWGPISIRYRGTKYFRPGFVHPWNALSANIITIPLLYQQIKTHLCSSDPTLILTDFSSFQEFSSSGHFCNRLLKWFLTHWGRVTQIWVFTLQLCKMDDANLRF